MAEKDSNQLDTITVYFEVHVLTLLHKNELSMQTPAYSCIQAVSKECVAVMFALTIHTVS